MLVWIISCENDNAISKRIWPNCVLKNSVINRPWKFLIHTFVTLSPCRSVLDFWKINLEKSSLANWIFSLFQTGFLLPVQPAKINFEIDFCRLKIQFFKLEFSKLIFQNSQINRGLVWKIVRPLVIVAQIFVAFSEKGNFNDMPHLTLFQIFMVIVTFLRFEFCKNFKIMNSAVNTYASWGSFWRKW